MRKIDSYVAAERELLERAWGVSIPTLRTTAAEASEEEPTTSRQYVPISSSDVSGDGYEDVLYFDIGRDGNSFMSDVALRARDGRGGRLLWAKEYGLPTDLLVLSPGDVTGDAFDDILVVRVDHSWTRSDTPCAPVCAYDDTLHIEWAVSLLSGRDAATVWERNESGSVRYTGGYAFPGPLITVARRTIATNALIDLRPSDDVDGDGERDFVLNLLGYEGLILFNQKASWEPRTYSADATVLSGRDGEELLTRSESGSTGSPSVIPAGDASGDGRGDLISTVPSVLESPLVCPLPRDCAKVRKADAIVRLLDGETGDVSWEAEVADEDVTDVAPVMTGSDLNGDRLDDIIIGLELGGGAERAIALSGRDGGRLWEFDTRLTDPPTAVGSLDGGAGSDVLFWEGWYPEESEAPGVLFRIRLRRIDGATGDQLFLTQHDLPVTERNGTIYAYSVGDVDGDGAPDIAHAMWQYDGWWIENGSASTVLRVESAATGRDVVRLERDRKALLFTGGDLVRGGVQDLLEGSTTYNDIGFELSGVEMPTGRTLWRRSDVLYSALFGPLDDRSGGGSDVLYGRTAFGNEEPRWRTRIDVLRGSTGARLWGAGHGMGDPPISDSPAPTTLILTARSTEVVQFSDRAKLEALLVDQAGSPLSNAPLKIRLGASESSVVTNSDGIATLSRRVTQRPGDLPFEVVYEGSEVFGPSRAPGTMTILKEATQLVIRRSDDRIVVRLRDGLEPVARKVVRLSTGSRTFARVRTDHRGRAARGIPQRYRAGKRTFRARFAGDAFYKPSTGRVR